MPYRKKHGIKVNRKDKNLFYRKDRIWLRKQHRMLFQKRHNN